MTFPNDATEPAVRCAAPGRVNLIGEHTDYSGGFVMPVAIDFRTIATIRPRSDGRILLYSENMGEEVWYAAESLPAKARQHWSDYPMGVAWSLAQEGVRAIRSSRAGGFPAPSSIRRSPFSSRETARSAWATACAKSVLPEGAPLRSNSRTGP